MRNNFKLILIAMIKKTTNNVGEYVKQLETSYTAGGIANWCSHFGEKFGDSAKVKYRVTVLPNNSTPRYIHK